ncbi:MAG: hypothetical protein VXY34_07395 [Bdellovibrionota bacterium]|nr:hypothetical protein [Bdellovibrionota bacterium]
MFYLKEFFKCFQSNPFKISCLCISSILLGLSVTHKDFIQIKIKERFSEEIVTPHFYALLSKKIDLKKMKNKLGSLPGIKEINYLDGKKIKKKVNKEVGALRLNNVLFKKNYTALKVLFDYDLPLEGQNLIKKYLSRYVGGIDIVIGKTIGEKKYKDRVAKEKIKITKIYWGAVFSPLLIYWIISFFVFSKGIWKKSYLIENFQRKRNVHLKILLSGTLFLITIIVTFSVIKKGSGPIGFLLLTILFLALSILANFQYREKKWM